MSPWTEDVLTLLAMPLSLGIATAAAGLVAMALRRRRTAAGLLGLGIAWLWLWSAPAFVSRATPLLVKQHPVIAVDAVPSADAIVVLLSHTTPASRQRDWPLASTTADSIWHGARLFAAGKAETIVVSGTDWRGKPSGADVMKEFLLTLEVPAPAVLVEGDSRNTFQNATFVARLAAQHDIETILLVTRGLHMNRALAAFRKAGLDTFPVPLSRQPAYRSGTLVDYVPSVWTLNYASRCLREWLGTLTYDWRGWI